MYINVFYTVMTYELCFYVIFLLWVNINVIISI
jgi:hypothetical protein